ncbi:hypothetical protein LINPERHAP1_LOCUS40014 [Linum perenne]
MSTDPKKGATVKKGHEQSMSMAISLLKEFNLPEGMLPLEDVIESGFVRETGFFWIVQRKSVKHEFKMIGKQVSYDKEISSYIEKNKARKLKGVKAKELLMWPPLNEMAVDEVSGKVRVKSLGGIAESFPAAAFAAGQ